VISILLPSDVVSLFIRKRYPQKITALQHKTDMKRAKDKSKLTMLPRHLQHTLVSRKERVLRRLSQPRARLHQRATALTKDGLVAWPPFVTRCTLSTMCVRDTPVQSSCGLTSQAACRGGWCNCRRRCWRGGRERNWLGVGWGWCKCRRRCWRGGRRRNWLSFRFWLGAGCVFYRALRRRALAGTMPRAPLHVRVVVTPRVGAAVWILHARCSNRCGWRWRHLRRRPCFWRRSRFWLWFWLWFWFRLRLRLRSRFRRRRWRRSLSTFVDYCHICAIGKLLPTWGWGPLHHRTGTMVVAYARAPCVYVPAKSSHVLEVAFICIWVRCATVCCPVPPLQSTLCASEIGWHPKGHFVQTTCCVF